MLTLAQRHIHQNEIKKSRFIAIVERADTPEAALAFLEKIREPEATHNCWAYKVDDQYRFTDDGEPGGTAGRPILAAIEGQGLDHVMVVVIRYFGGTKLGAGGLVRAYGGTAAECLRTANRVEVLPRAAVVLTLPFDAIGSTYSVLDQYDVKKLDETYSEDGLVLTIELVEAEILDFEVSLRDATRGSAKLTRDA